MLEVQLHSCAENKTVTVAIETHGHADAPDLNVETCGLVLGGGYWLKKSNLNSNIVVIDLMTPATIHNFLHMFLDPHPSKRRRIE